MKFMKQKKIANTIHLIALFLFLLPLLNETEASSKNTRPAKHFVLVHGACHGAWSWFRLVAMIKSSGNNVTALDMTAAGINPVQVDELEDSISDYFQPLRNFMASIPPHERVILVGHSHGGLGIAQAMEMFPEKIAAAVFVDASMIGPDLSISALDEEIMRRGGLPSLDSYFVYGNGPHNRPTAFAMGPNHLAKDLYQLSPTEDLALATLLVRPIYLYSGPGMSKELVLSSEKYGSVNRIFIVLGEDGMLGKGFQEWMIQKNPPNEVFEIEGADHMVMNSKPVELLFCLLDIGERYS